MRPTFRLEAGAPIDTRGREFDTTLVPIPPTVSLHDSRKTTRTTLKVVVLLGAVLTIVFLVSFAFSQRGISELQQSRKRVHDLQVEIDRLKGENDRLKKEIESLRKSTFAVERIAREHLDMSKPGETVYVLPENAKPEKPAPSESRDNR
ncbi:MAG: septum formation initiator family protein [Thermoanaerobaculia bacterium]